VVYSWPETLMLWVERLRAPGRALSAIPRKQAGMGIELPILIETTRAVGAAAEAKQATEQSSKDAWRNLRHPTIGEYVGLS
jgi:hypothetical protein